MAAELLSVSRLQRRVFGMFILLAIGLPVAENVISRTVTPAKETLYELGGTRGPFAGARSGGDMVLGAPSSTFAPGADVLWENQLTVNQGIAMMGEGTLWCDGRRLYIESARLLATQTRAGWKTGIMTLPTDAAGDCEIRRHAEFWNAAGKTEQRDFPVLSFQVRAP